MEPELVRDVVDPLVPVAVPFGVTVSPRCLFALYQFAQLQSFRGRVERAVATDEADLARGLELLANRVVGDEP